MGGEGAEIVRRRLLAGGVVQGVGFRPTVYRIAVELGLSGFVLNDARGVVVEVEGPAALLDRFAGRLKAELPPPGRVDSLLAAGIAPRLEPGFAIAVSRGGGEPEPVIPPDVATCPDCLRELFDPADRRFLYPFVTCTLCGPRYSVVREVPYDRVRTSMADFEMCSRCREEYGNPADRRFHSQTNACPVCGPRLSFVDAAGDILAEGDRALLAALDLLGRGGIVAIKGLGGFHLCCDALDRDAVARLRQRKRRPDKPLALMAGSLDGIRPYARVSSEEAALLESRQAPIVLLQRDDDARPLDGIADGNGTLGLMLPYTPLHRLLFGHPEAPVRPSLLVMTSANVSDEPIVIDNDEARRRLARIADRFLIHDRPIVIRSDDSLVHWSAGPVTLRRSRGQAPEPLTLAGPYASGSPVLALGAELKNTICLLRGGRAYLSHHIGDLATPSAEAMFEETVGLLCRFYGVEPEVCVRDLHPDHAASRWAGQSAGRFRRVVTAQHHHAHVVSVMAEHRLSDRLIGVALDGTGLGPDGTIWGGEFLACDTKGYERFGHIVPVPQPGGDAAARHPGRMAASWLSACGIEPDPALRSRLGIDDATWRLVAGMLAARVGSPLTSSAGRLFDAAAALLGLCPHATFEGQAAIALEWCAGRTDRAEPLPFAVGRESDGRLRVDPAEAVAALAERGADPAARASLARGFHLGLTVAVADACDLIRQATGLSRVALSGGCFQNRILLGLATETLAGRGFAVYTNRLVPPNDGGVSLGQAVIGRECG